MNYAKAAAAVLATSISALVGFLTDGAVTNVEWINVAILAAGAAAVFTAPNVPGAPVTKAVLAVVTAVLTLAASLILDGLSTSDVLQLFVVALAALGIYAVPNAGAPDQDREHEEPAF